MDVKVGGEAQICRLCGHFESIYIDVFGEEGSRRLLGLKIHSKINILIDETDPLPKTICVQCLGKLEFVCDFQEECLRTQRLLRDRYDLPPLPNLDPEISEQVNLKSDDSLHTPSTSTNENSSEKNLNSTADIENVDPSPENRNEHKNEEEVSRPKRSSRTSPQTRSKINEKDATEGETNRRWLRSRNITEAAKTPEKFQKQKRATSKSSSSKSTNFSRVTRLRSQNKKKSSAASLPSQDEKKSSEILGGKPTIQIPTSALNKVLTAVSGSRDVEVCVKESKGRNGDIEDISFTLELRKKDEETESVVTVLAKVFPDQGSCLVDSEIVDLLEINDNSELNHIISSVTKSKSSKEKDGSSNKIIKLQELEKRLSSISDNGDVNGEVSSRNPEELYRMDGEEIRVDDNVEGTTVDGQSGYSCKLCKKFYERRDKCTVHVKTHLGIKQYACTLCSAKFVCKSDVMKHIRCSHTNPRPMQCPKCPKRFRSKFDLTEHDNVHKGIKPYSCNDCGQSYHHKVSLQMHVKSHLPPQNLACEYCGKVFPFRTRLLSHIGSVHLKNRRNFRCRFCYNLYSSLTVLNEHIKTRHATTYTCEICSKTFKVASKYKAHVLQHSNPKPFVCNICNNKYASKAFLNEHLLKHEGLRKHVCQKCGASFAQASHLAAHRHVHGEKTHACPECGRKFNRRDNMKVHRKRHFAESGRIVAGQKTQTLNEKEPTEKLENANSHEKIKQDDELPKTVCIRCVGTLEFLCDFLQQCQDTQEILMQKGDSKSKNDEESNKENVIRYERNSATIEVPAHTQKEDETIDQQTVKPGKSFALCEKILNEIHQNGNLNRNDSKSITQNRRIKQTVSLKHRLRRNDLKPIQKFPLQISNENIQKDEEQLFIISEHSPKMVTTTQQIIQESRVSMKPVEIRPTLRKFIWSPADSFLVSSTSEKSVDMKSKDVGIKNIQLNVNNSDESQGKPVEIIEKLDKFMNYSQGKENMYVKVQTKELPTKSLTIITENNNQESKESSPHISTLSVCEFQECKSTDESSTNPEKSRVNAFDIESSKKKFRKSMIKCKRNIEPSLEDGKYPHKRLEREIERFSENPPAFFTKISKERDEPLKVNSPSSSINSISSCLDIETSKCKIRAKNEVILEPEGQKNPCKPASQSSGESSSDDEYNSEVRTETSKQKRRKAGAIYGTISQLISKEEKEAIEKYYTVNMSVVNDRKVEENLKCLNKKQTMCSICNTIYPRMDKCRVHIWGHLEMKPYKCKACDFATVTVTNIRCHIRKSHLKIKPFECNFCKKRYVTAVLLEEHLNTHSGSRPYKCKVCDFSSASRQVLSYHTTTHKTVKDVTCDICGKEFFSKGRMRAHIITHNKNKELMCKYCSHHFSNSEALNKHYDNVHSKDYICDICGKATKSRKALHNHQNVHSEAKFKCTLCPNVYKSGHILKEHLLKHKGIRKYKCEVCEKDFAQQSHLAAHMAVHSEKRFKCPGCQRAFNRHDNMKIHTKRCAPFNANPHLKDLLTHRAKRSSSIGEKDGKKDKVEPVMNFPEIQREKVNINTEEEESMELDNEQTFAAHGKLSMDDSEAFQIGQVVVIPISSASENVDYHANETINVTENILDLECF